MPSHDIQNLMRELIEIKLNRARLEARRSNYNKAIYIDEVKNFPEDELKRFDAKIIIKDGAVYLIECPSKGHEFIANTLMMSMINSLKPHLTNPSDIGSVGMFNFDNFVNMYESTTSHRKIPDQSITFPSEMMKHEGVLIIIEVAFNNETLLDLLKEGSNWLNGYSNCRLAILIKARFNSSGCCNGLMLFIFGKNRDEMACHSLPYFSFFELERMSNERLELYFKVKVLLKLQVGIEDVAREDFTLTWSLETTLLSSWCGRDLFKGNLIVVDFTEAGRTILNVLKDQVEH